MKLLAPAGSWESLTAAINSGADAVYFGSKLLNMRANAKNFEISELVKVVSFCHSHNVEAYLTANTIIYQDELDVVTKLLKQAAKAKIDGIIAWDFSVLVKARELGLPISISTQASVSNFESLKFFYDTFGVKCVVLARELSLDAIATIKKKIVKAKLPVMIECFGHGAMCVAESGRCFLSQYTYGHSANRGDCLQPCRRQYNVKDIETRKELQIDNHFILSPKDLCTIPIIDKLISSGIDMLKIEGRNRSPEYVATVVSAYREAIDACLNGTFDKSLVDKLVALVKTVYNRKFHTGFYLGTPTADDFTDLYGSDATRQKKYVGFVKKVYNKINVFEVELNSSSVSVGDTLLVTGKTTGAVETTVVSIRDHYDKSVKTGLKGETVGVKVSCSSKFRIKDKVFLIV
ncbi:U32 family peptidase [Candidatus Woesearchaeota archaeon]|nr:U32 family peptidase [Candidatus Woesearchaeota archaeon]